LIPVTFAVVIVAPSDAGLNVKPVWFGVTVYAPLAKPVNVNPPEAFAVVAATEAPLKVTVAPDPPAPLIVPEIENV
jgi:hypothetical protein